MAINYENLYFELPEDLDRAKKSGEFAYFEELIDCRLKDARLPDALRERLEMEKTLLPRFIRRYPYDRARALETCARRIKDFTESEFDALEKAGYMDYIYVGGEKKYLSSFCSTLIKMLPEIGARRTDRPAERIDGTEFEPFYADIVKNGRVKYRFALKTSLRIEDEYFKPGEKYSVQIPVPAVSSQQKEEEIEISAPPDALIASPSACQRTISFSRVLSENEPFEFVSRYTSEIRYVRPFEDAPHVVYPDTPAPTEDDLSEQYPHVVFTPFLKRLARQIVGGETRPLYQAKLIYDFITLNVKYSFMRSYITIPRHAEYCALNLKGDCGIQAILFVTLCRILGIPARWQSGLTVDKFESGDHDWAQFHTEEFGWLFADPSYGGGGTRCNDEIKREFYFGNVDPFRMVANRRYLSPFEFEKRFIRIDPCDSQDGEVETETEGLDSICFDKSDKTLEFERI